MTTPPPTRWHTREDSGLRLDRDGRWWHDDVLVEHPKIVEAFNQGLQPTDDGRFKLSFGWDWCFVQVEDAAYRVLRTVDLSQGAIGLELSDRTTEPLDPSTLSVDEDGVLACRVKEGRAKARFGRDAQFTLGSLLELRDDALVLRVAGAEYPVRGSEALTRAPA